MEVAVARLSIGRPGVVALVAAALLALPAVSARRVDAATIVVNSTLDGPDLLLADGVCDAGGGVCTLRAAIQQANFNVGADTINFNITPSGVETIAPTTALPDVTDAVTIDGTTQPGFTGTPIIELSGANAGAVDGLKLTGGSSTIRGLVINRWARTASR